MLPPVARQPDCWRALKIKIQRALGRTELKSEPGGPLYHPPHTHTHTPPAPRIASLCCQPAPRAPRPRCLRVELVPCPFHPRPSPQVCSLLPSNQPPLGHSVPVAGPSARHTHPSRPSVSLRLLCYPLPARERPLFSTASRPCSPHLSVPLMARPILRADSDRSSGRLVRH